MSVEEHRRHIYEGEPPEDLIEALEPDQLVAARTREKVARRRFGPGLNAALWALRVFVLLLAAMVAYTFLHGVLHPLR